jgi:hypothetical protein
MPGCPLTAEGNFRKQSPMSNRGTRESMSSSFRHAQLLQQKNWRTSLNSLLDGNAKTLPKFGATPIIIVVNQEKLQRMVYWYSGFLPRLFPPLIAFEQFPTPKAFAWHGPGGRYPSIHVVLLWVTQCSYFCQCTVPAPWQILAMLPQPHRLRSIADQPCLRPHPTTMHTPSLSCIPKTLPIASVASHVDNCGYLTGRTSSRPSCGSLVIHMSSNLSQLPPNCSHAGIFSSLPKA